MEDYFWIRSRGSTQVVVVSQKAMAIEPLEELHPFKEFHTYDIDGPTDVTKEWGITQTPCFVVFVAGVRVALLQSSSFKTIDAFLGAFE